MLLFFDIGGSKLRVGTSEDGSVLNEDRVCPTPKTFDLGVHAIQMLARELAKGKIITQVVGGLAGPLDREKSTLVNSPHLKDWIGKPIKQVLEDVFRASVRLENDNALVALGEAVSGAGAGYDIVAYISVGTGVGGARIVDGQIDKNAFGFEPGHQIIDSGGALHENRKCHACNNVGDLEGYISGTALKNQFGKPGEMLQDQRIWDRAAHHLALGLANTIVHWSPHAVVLGGSVMKSIPLEYVKAHLTRILNIFPEMPQLFRALLGDKGGLYGALAYAQNTTNKDNLARAHYSHFDQVDPRPLTR